MSFKPEFENDDKQKFNFRRHLEAATSPKSLVLIENSASCIYLLQQPDVIKITLGEHSILTATINQKFKFKSKHLIG
jgi:hypothetical protein